VAYDARDHRLDRPIKLLAAELRSGTFAGATAF
jgi:hypothetical protein